MEFADKRPVAVISTQRGTLEQRWLQRTFKAATTVGVEVHVIDPELTNPGMLRECLIRGTYKAVVVNSVDLVGAAFYKKARVSGDGDGNFDLVIRRNPGNTALAEIVAWDLGATRFTY